MVLVKLLKRILRCGHDNWSGKKLRHTTKCLHNFAYMVDCGMVVMFKGNKSDRKTEGVFYLFLLMKI